MTKYLIILLFVIGASELKAEDYVTIEANVGMELSVSEDHWEGDTPFEFRVTYVNQFNKTAYFTGGYSHLSNVMSGPPFNNDFENVLDRVFVGFGVKFNL